MNRSNVLEIKKALKMTAGEVNAIDTICTCLVNGKNEILMKNTEKFARLDEEEQFKYADIIKATLSGTIDKKLINLEIENDNKAMLSNAHKNIFASEEERDAFFLSVIENYSFGENYLIVAAHGIYDAPVKTSDGKALEDETNTYDFMIVSICPMHSTKAGLSFDTKEKRMTNAGQMQIAKAPVNGFLYPAFNERESDNGAILYFTKAPEDNHPEFMEYLIGHSAPISSSYQQKIFENIISEVTDDKADLELYKTLQDNLTTMTKENDKSSKEKKLTKSDIKHILKDAGISDDKLSDFDHIYERAGGNDSYKFTSQNLITLEKFNIKAPDVEIKVKPDKRKMVRQEVIGGKNCIVVELEEGDIKVNKVLVKRL